MSKEQANPAAPAKDDVLEAELSLGQALAVIQRFLPKLDDFGAASEVQAAFKRAAACIENARAAHQRVLESRQAAIMAKAQAGVQGEIVAAIAAAVTALFGSSFRL
ncbi:MAG: hypothetical protein EG825_16555, partial [Rhodocyclaceae bacterium]|nr:hypothetical protein [Rhodocyclaceae bacterium]